MKVKHIKAFCIIAAFLSLAVFTLSGCGGGHHDAADVTAPSAPTGLTATAAPLTT